MINNSESEIFIMLNAQKVKEAALAMGADIVGIGSMDRFEGAPKEFDPRFIMPKAKSIIGVGFRIHRGLLRGIEEGTYWGGYSLMGYANINDGYAPIVIRELATLLEDEGYESCPYHNSSVRYGINFAKPVSPEKPGADVMIHFRIAGVICGMGEIGWSKMFLCPEFGPAVRLAFVLTELELEPDPIMEPHLCDRCMACARACPVGAMSLDRNKTVSIDIDGHKVEWGENDESLCHLGFQAGGLNNNPFLDENTRPILKEALDRVHSTDNKPSYAERMVYTQEMAKYMQPIRNGYESFHHPGALCGAAGCTRACLDHLDRKGVLTKKFHHPFREKPVWKLPDGE